MEVWRYTLPFGDTLRSGRYERIPRGAVPLCVMVQRAEIVVYMLLNPTAEKVGRRFAVVATGWHRESMGDWAYIGSVETRAPDRAWHVFDLGEE